MAKKGLIAYASWTGNTEKVALRFKKVFDKYGWECDIFKIEGLKDLKSLPFDFNNYDLVCVGSPVIGKRPTDDIAFLLGGPPALKLAPSSPENLAYARGEIEIHGHPPDEFEPHEKIYDGPETKKGIIFVTAGERHIPLLKSVDPALSLMDCYMAHRKIQTIGRFYCPGKGRPGSPESLYIKDLPSRPNERDLMKAEIFLEEKLEEYF